VSANDSDGSQAAFLDEARNLLISNQVITGLVL
jgi:hypothetical protein